jgi:hypothetical protein
MLKSLSDDRHVQAMLGVYLLGGMSAHDEARVRAHLDMCQECLEEHDYLAVVPQWLDLVKESLSDSGAQPAREIAGCPRIDAGPDDVDPGSAVEFTQNM